MGNAREGLGGPSVCSANAPLEMYAGRRFSVRAFTIRAIDAIRFRTIQFHLAYIKAFLQSSKITGNVA